MEGAEIDEQICKLNIWGKKKRGVKDISSKMPEKGRSKGKEGILTFTNGQ